VNRVEASAPGKAVVSGEYAVLLGAPAISLALSRRARVTVMPNGLDVLSVTAPGYLAEPVRGRVRSDGSVHWIDRLPRPSALRLFECVWEQSRGTLREGLDVELDTREFVDAATGLKLGLGSSAALAVALTGALAVSSGVDVLAAADAAHRSFQAGRGSGVDVATGYHGGVIMFRRGSPARQVAWIDGLAWRLLWSGRSSDTASSLARLDRSGNRNSDELVAAAEAVAAAWRHDAAATVLHQLARFAAALDRYGIDHGLGIFEAGHRALADLAGPRSDLLYKPCGAGGGDIGIVLGISQTAVDAYAAEAAARRYTALDAQLDPVGLLVRETPA